MTNPGEDAGQTGSSDSSAASKEPSSGGYEAPPIEQQSQASQPSEHPGYTPPPAYNSPPSGYEAPNYPPPSGYPPPNFTPPDYPPPPPPSYPTPGGPQGGYGPPGYSDPSSYGAPSYPPPQFGAPPPGYGQPPTGYPAPDYGSAYGQQPTSTTNTMAIASLVASCIGVLCGIGSIVGIVLGVIALNQVKETRQGGHGLAIAGIAVGGVTLLINVIWTIVVLSS